jgi:hypothetical protein
MTQAPNFATHPPKTINHVSKLFSRGAAFFELAMKLLCFVGAVCAACLSFSFESGTQSWVIGNSANGYTTRYGASFRIKAILT